MQDASAIWRHAGRAATRAEIEYPGRGRWRFGEASKNSVLTTKFSRNNEAESAGGWAVRLACLSNTNWRTHVRRITEFATPQEAMEQSVERAGFLQRQQYRDRVAPRQ